MVFESLNWKADTGAQANSSNAFFNEVYAINSSTKEKTEKEVAVEKENFIAQTQVEPVHRERTYRPLESTIRTSEEWLQSPAGDLLRSQPLIDQQTGAPYTNEDYKRVVEAASNFIRNHDNGRPQSERLNPFSTLSDSTFYQVNQRGLNAYIESLQQSNTGDPQIQKRLDIASTMKEFYSAFASQVPANRNLSQEFLSSNSTLRRTVDANNPDISDSEMRARLNEYTFQITPDGIDRVNDKDTLASGITATKIAIANHHSDHFGRKDAGDLPKVSFAHANESDGQRGYELTADIVAQGDRFLRRPGNPFRELATYTLDDYKSVFDEIDQTIVRTGPKIPLVSQELGSGSFTHREAKTFYDQESAKLAEMQPEDELYQTQFKKVKIAEVLYLAGPCAIQSQTAQHIAEVWDPSRIGSQLGTDHAFLYTHNDLLSVALKDGNPFEISANDIAISFHHSDYWGPQDPDKNHALNGIEPDTPFSVWDPEQRHIFIRVGRQVDANGNLISEGDPRIPYLPPMTPVQPYLQRGARVPENNVLDYEGNRLPGT